MKRLIFFFLSVFVSSCSCPSGAPPATVNMEVDVCSHGAPSTVIAQTVATEEPPATAVSSHQQAICCFLNKMVEWCVMGCQ